MTKKMKMNKNKVIVFALIVFALIVTNITIPMLIGYINCFIDNRTKWKWQITIEKIDGHNYYMYFIREDYNGENLKYKIVFIKNIDFLIDKYLFFTIDDISKNEILLGVTKNGILTYFSNGNIEIKISEKNKINQMIHPSNGSSYRNFIISLFDNKSSFLNEFNILQTGDSSIKYIILNYTCFPAK